MSPRWEPNPDTRTDRSIVYTLHAHLVFTPKYRRRVFDDAMPTRCEQITAKVCEDSGAELPEFNGETDHVHLLVHYPPEVALSRLVGSLTGVSARLLRQELTGRVNRAIMRGHSWSRPTSPPPTAAPHYKSSRSTSKTKAVPTWETPRCGGAPHRVVNDAIHPAPKGGFLARDR